MKEYAKIYSEAFARVFVNIFPNIYFKNIHFRPLLFHKHIYFGMYKKTCYVL